MLSKIYLQANKVYCFGKNLLRKSHDVWLFPDS